MMMQHIDRGAGIDVHKKLLVVTIRGNDLKKSTREFENTASQIERLIEWLIEHRIVAVAMESTGVYWRMLYRMLEQAGLKPMVVNAAHLKHVPGRKTDKLDSEWIANLLIHGLLRKSFVPDQQQQHLRELTRFRRRLVEFLSSFSNRLVKQLEDAGVKLTSVVSQVKGVTATRLIDMLLEGRTDYATMVEEVYRKGLKHSKQDFVNALGNGIGPTHGLIIGYIKSVRQAITEVKEDVEKKIAECCKQYDKELAILVSVPGIALDTAYEFIAEVGLDMSVFPSDAHLAAWAGVCPSNNESGGKRRRTRSRQGNKHIKRAMVQAAHVAVRLKGSKAQAIYRNIAARRGGKKAIVAVAHKMTRWLYKMLVDKAAYSPGDVQAYQKMVEHRRAEYYIQRLKGLGYSLDEIDLGSGTENQEVELVEKRE